MRMPRLRQLTGWTGLAAALTIFFIVAPAVTHAAESEDSLAATNAVPWNPAHPMAARRPWEQAINFPGRVVSLPLAGLGAATRKTLTWVEDHEIVRFQPITAPSAEGVKPARVLTFNAPHLGDRAGLGAGFIVRTPTSTAKLPTASLRYAATVNFYNSTQAALSRGPFSLQYGYDWRPQMQFFGIGRGTTNDVTSDYAFQDEYVRAMATFALSDSATRNSPPAELRLWAGPRSAVTRHGRESGRASYEVLYPELAPATLNVREDHFVWGGGFTLDSRRGSPHWAHGGRLRLDAERMSPPIRVLALHSASDVGATSTRLVADAEGGFSFLRDPRTLRLRVRVTDLTIDHGADRFLFADYSRLGGREGLAGFTPGRFVDRDALLARATYVFPLSRLLEADVHGEWGSVYHDLWHEARLGSLEHSFGFAFRGRSQSSAHGSIGLDFSREGFRVNYAWGGVE